MRKIRLKTNITLFLALIAVVISGFTFSTNVIYINNVVENVEPKPFDDGICNITYNDVTRYHLNKDRKLRNSVALETVRYFESLKRVTAVNSDSLKLRVKNIFKEYGYETDFVGVTLE